MSSTHKHYDCPRCDESIFFDVDAQICNRCEWGLNGDTTPTGDEPDIDFSTTLDTDEDSEPIDDPDNADIPIGAHHTVLCIDCEHTVSLIGIHRGEYTDGVSLGCDCTTLGSLPSELAAGELPSNWEVKHETDSSATT